MPVVEWRCRLNHGRGRPCHNVKRASPPVAITRPLKEDDDCEYEFIVKRIDQNLSDETNLIENFTAHSRANLRHARLGCGNGRRSRKISVCSLVWAVAGVWPRNGK